MSNFPFTRATPHQEKGPYRQKELGEALGGGLKGEKGAEMAWVHLGGLAAGRLQGQPSEPKSFQPFLPL